MKHGRRPTLAQSKLIAGNQLDPGEWLVVKDTSTMMELVHRNGDKHRAIHKG